MGIGLGRRRAGEGTDADPLLLGQRGERLGEDAGVHRARLERGHHVGERHDLDLHVLDREAVAAEYLVEHPLHGGAAGVQRHRPTLEIGDPLHLRAPHGLPHGEVVLQKAHVERRDELDRQLRRHRVEAGGAHARAAELELAGGHLARDLGAARQAHHLDTNAGRRQVPIGQQVQHREGIGRDVADLDRRGLGDAGPAVTASRISSPRARRCGCVHVASPPMGAERHGPPRFCPTPPALTRGSPGRGIYI